jgi:TonB family protein
MKHPTGYAKPRRLAAPRKKVRLNLQRRRNPGPDNELEIEQKSHFWKWVGLVALLHVAVIGMVYWVYQNVSMTKPPEQFISLLPEGDVVKGTPGAQQAHKLGPTTPAPVMRQASPPTPPLPPAPAPIQPPKPAPVAMDKPAPKPPPPKVKVDLTLVDRPVPATDKPVTKPKHLKKPVAKTTENPEDQDHEAAVKPDSSGLSKEQIAEKLGEKLDSAGVKDAAKSGASGSANSHANPFADFYASIRDQVMSEWQSPNLADETAVSPIVQIHVEKDGRVPPESVQLIQSSGNSTYDDSALAAAKNLGYLHEPLPDGCPPDIPITFKLTR